MKFFPFIIIFLLLLGFSSCEEPFYLPKPRAYPKIDFPKGDKEKFVDRYGCPFSFVIPEYAVSEQDTTYFGEKPESTCWFNLHVKNLNSTIHCTYKKINNVKELNQLINDSYTFANKHNVKADFIDDYFIRKPNRVYCRILEIQGDVASPFQFFVTDSLNHFMRGSLYFNARPNQDSLAPAIEFMKKDIIDMINSFEWDKR